MGFAIESSSTRFSLFVIVFSLLFLSLNLIAAIGLYRLKKWGFIFAYIAIPFSTFFLATSYIPFVARLFPIEFSWAAMMSINIFLVLCIIYLDLRLRRQQKS